MDQQIEEDNNKKSIIYYNQRPKLIVFDGTFKHNSKRCAKNENKCNDTSSYCFNNGQLSLTSLGDKFSIILLIIKNHII